MELTTLFSALSQVIFYSIFHGLFVYALVKLILKAFPEMPSSERYKILYLGMIWIFVGFIISFSDAYLTGLEKLESSAQMQTFEHKTNFAGPFKADSLLPGFSTWIAVLYFAGLIVQFTMLLSGLFRVNIIRKRNLENVDLSWNSQLNILSKKLEIEKKVAISLCKETFIPCTIGFLKPIIILPVSIINSLSPAEVEAILLHELAHIRRNDYLFNVIQRIMEMILFFNPAIWLLGKEIRKEREFCCDDLVIQNTSSPLIYAQALLQIADSNTPAKLSLSLSASGEEKYTLLNRIKRLTNMKPMNSNPKHHLFTSLTVVAVCLSLAWIVPAEQVIKNQKENRSGIMLTKADTVMLELPALPSPADAPQAPPTPPVQLMPGLALAPAAPMVPEVPSLSAPAVPAPPAIPFLPDTNELKKQFNSPEWKKQMEVMKKHAEEMKKQFESPEWKKQMADMQLNAEQMKSHALAMQKEFDSPEWKKKIEDMKNHSLEMKKQFDSPEWKKKIEDMKIQAEEMRKQFDSPEWKKKIEDMKINSEEMRKKFDSPEWKKQIEEIQKKAEEAKLEGEKAEKNTKPRN